MAASETVDYEGPREIIGLIVAGCGTTCDTKGPVTGMSECYARETRRVAVVGGRSFTDTRRLRDVLDALALSYDLHIVSGGARGADRLAECYARDNSLPLTVYEAQWDKYGKAAGMIRNRLIVDAADLVVAFWDGESKGTKNSISLAEKAGKPVTIERY